MQACVRAQTTFTHTPDSKDTPSTVSHIHTYTGAHGTNCPLTPDTQATDTDAHGENGPDTLT